MIMLQYLNQCSRGRGAWLLMALTAFILELVALWFQHVMLLQPCVMCIYERCALFGIMGAGLVGAIAPKTPLRYVAIILSEISFLSIIGTNIILFFHFPI